MPIAPICCRCRTRSLPASHGSWKYN
jgi:hypothetical protein